MKLGSDADNYIIIETQNLLPLGLSSEMRKAKTSPRTIAKHETASKSKVEARSAPRGYYVNPLTPRPLLARRRRTSSVRKGIVRHPRVARRRLSDNRARRGAAADADAVTPVARGRLDLQPQSVTEASRVVAEEQPHRVVDLTQPLQRAGGCEAGRAQRSGEGQSASEPETAAAGE